jgi:class 3 adenylate cyclase
LSSKTAIRNNPNNSDKKGMTLKPELQRWPTAIGLSLLAHLALVPLLAIYGVHICPVLHEQGFSFGCKFNLAYVLCSLTVSVLANAGLFYVLYQNTRRMATANLEPTKHPFLSLREFPLVMAAVHIIVFICGIFFLLDYLEAFDLPEPTTIRMCAAFTIAAIFLAVLQSELIGWAQQHWLRTGSEWSTLSFHRNESSQIYRRWAVSLAARNAPFWAGFVVVMIYTYSKVLELKELYNVDDDFFASRTREALQILALSLGWIIVVDLIKFGKESVLVKDIQMHIEELSKGEAAHSSREVSTGVWQELFIVLNKATKTLAQRSRLMRGLSAYAATQVVEKVLQKDELDTFGHRKPVAILMSDLRGFTQLSNSLEPEAVVNLLNLYFEAMINVCADHDMVVDKFIGDGLLGYANPEIGSGADQCSRALRTAEAMLASLAKLNEKIVEMGHAPLQIGIGLHWGDVIVGSIGSKNRLQHTIIGDAVNTAARLESKCKELHAVVVASKSLIEQTQSVDFAALIHHGAISIRGLAQPVEVYIVPDTNQRAEQQSA